MATTERMPERRRQCMFRLDFQNCPFRKLARKVRGNTAYDVPTVPAGSLSDRWSPFNTVSGTFPPPEAFSPAHPFPQPLPLGPQTGGFPVHRVHVELNQAPSDSSVDMEVDPETGERA